MDDERLQAIKEWNESIKHDTTEPYRKLVRAHLVIADLVAEVEQLRSERDEAVAAMRQNIHDLNRGARMVNERADRMEVWARKLLSISEYVGPGVGGSEAWLCAFPTCGGHTYVNLDGETTEDGGYRRTPPSSRDWHARDCPIRALVQDLGLG